MISNSFESVVFRHQTQGSFPLQLSCRFVDSLRWVGITQGYSKFERFLKKILEASEGRRRQNRWEEVEGVWGEVTSLGSPAAVATQRLKIALSYTGFTRSVIGDSKIILKRKVVSGNMNISSGSLERIPASQQAILEFQNKSRIIGALETIRSEETTSSLRRKVEELEESMRGYDPGWRWSENSGGLEGELQEFGLWELLSRLDGALLFSDDEGSGETPSEKDPKITEGELKKKVEEKNAAANLKKKLNEITETLVKYPAMQSIRKKAEKLLEEVGRELGRRKWDETKRKVDKVLGNMGEEQGGKGVKELEKTLNEAIDSLKEIEKQGKSKVEELRGRIETETRKLTVGQLALKMQELYDKLTLPEDLRGELRKTLSSLGGPLGSPEGAGLLEGPLGGLVEALESKASHETISRRIVETNWAVKRYNEGDY